MRPKTAAFEMFTLQAGEHRRTYSTKTGLPVEECQEVEDAEDGYDAHVNLADDLGLVDIGEAFLVVAALGLDIGREVVLFLDVGGDDALLEGGRGWVDD